MRLVSYHSEVSLYTSWYDFRKELGNKLGYIPLNSAWLDTKPKMPLPWNDSDLRAALSRLSHSTAWKPRDY